MTAAQVVCNNCNRKMFTQNEGKPSFCTYCGSNRVEQTTFVELDLRGQVSVYQADLFTATPNHPVGQLRLL